MRIRLIFTEYNKQLKWLCSSIKHCGKTKKSWQQNRTW